MPVSLPSVTESLDLGSQNPGIRIFVGFSYEIADRNSNVIFGSCSDDRGRGLVSARICSDCGLSAGCVCGGDGECDLSAGRICGDNR